MSTELLDQLLVTVLRSVEGVVYLLSTIPPEAFWARYAVLADARENALAWVDDHLVEQLMSWPEPAPGPQVPFMIVLLRGKCYLRMQYQPADMSVLDHATDVFVSACDSAMGAFKR